MALAGMGVPQGPGPVRPPPGPAPVPAAQGGPVPFATHAAPLVFPGERMILAWSFIPCFMSRLLLALPPEALYVPERC